MKRVHVLIFIPVILCLLVFSGYAQNNDRSKDIYLEYDKVTGYKQFYKLDNKDNKVPFDHITPSHLRNYKNLVVIVNNINPSLSQLVFSTDKISSDASIDLSELSTLNGILQSTSGIDPLSISMNLSGIGSDRGGDNKSVNVFMNPSLIVKKNNEDLVNILVKKKKEYDNITRLRFLVERLKLQNYNFETIDQMYRRYIQDLSLDSISENQEGYFNEEIDSNMIIRTFSKITREYFVSSGLVSKYHENKTSQDTSQDDLVSRGTRGTETWDYKGSSYMDKKIQEDLLPFFEDDENLDKVLEDYTYLLNFQQGLNRENYTKKVTIPLNESYGKVMIKHYENDLDTTRLELFSFYINPKPSLTITTSFGFTLSKFSDGSIIGYDIETDSIIPQHGFREVESEYFPALGSFINLTYDRPDRILNFGASIGVIIPIRENASPTLSVGPTLSFGEKRNKINVHVSYGFAPRETYSRDEIDFNTIYDGKLEGSEFNERNIFEQTISIGVSWGVGGN